jgi:hypothetical protein
MSQTRHHVTDDYTRSATRTNCRCAPRHRYSSSVDRRKDGDSFHGVSGVLLFDDAPQVVYVLLY